MGVVVVVRINLICSDVTTSGWISNAVQINLLLLLSSTRQEAHDPVTGFLPTRPVGRLFFFGPLRYKQKTAWQEAEMFPGSRKVWAVLQLEQQLVPSHQRVARSLETKFTASLFHTLQFALFALHFFLFFPAAYDVMAIVLFITQESRSIRTFIFTECLQMFAVRCVQLARDWTRNQPVSGQTRTLDK